MNEELKPCPVCHEELREALDALQAMQAAAADNGAGLKVADEVLLKHGRDIALHREGKTAHDAYWAAQGVAKNWNRAGRLTQRAWAAVEHALSRRAPPAAAGSGAGREDVAKLVKELLPEVSIADWRAEAVADCILILLSPPAAEGLHPETARLVKDFSAALAGKLSESERKYGYSDEWRTMDWEAECQRQLAIHVAKGDPRDVAAYAAFCWARGWRTTAPAAEGGLVEAVTMDDALRVAEAAAWRDYETTPEFWSTRRQIEMIAGNAFRAGQAALAAHARQGGGGGRLVSAAQAVVNAARQRDNGTWYLEGDPEELLSDLASAVPALAPAQAGGGVG